ncbi:hypothetical protein [Methylovulum psychrotolerans]|uniref:DUF2971 domain-containing protein n=1 Tax=Methylovulum psychrotolerans TaxID=1704499 RepID=A0A1Z4C2R3_9GAMM|nr:hypothetical protein [Methylovulum psychrotolerans]ASF47800.1 hypothetical protein CEK71_17970 [Methylovulum psychrotolerans]
MYEVHPVFEQPSDENEKVWRYMDFTKFISLLESSALYFTRADKFEDPFEGCYPKEEILAVEEMLDVDKSSRTEEQRRLEMEFFCDKSQRRKKYVFINCWHLNNHESAAMWKLYLKSNEGIAIQSTYQKLKNAFISDQRIYLGHVKYIDYETEYFDRRKHPSANLLRPFIYKRKSFGHEKEVRAIIEKLDGYTVNENPHEQKNTIHGLQAAINLDVLIEKIYVAPNAEPWFLEIVKSIIRRYDKHYEVMQSDLYKSPLY